MAIYRGTPIDEAAQTVGTAWTAVGDWEVGSLPGLPVAALTVANRTGGGALNGARLEALNHGDNADDDDAWFPLIDSEASGGDEWQSAAIESLVFADDTPKGLAAGSEVHVIVRLWAVARVRLSLKAASEATVDVTGGIKQEV